MIYLKDVVTLELSAESCNGCGICLDVCPRDVFLAENGTVTIQNRDNCMECGACALNCPFEAVSVVAGVGCAAAVINSVLGRTDADCCCVIEPNQPAEPVQISLSPGN